MSVRATNAPSPSGSLDDVAVASQIGVNSIAASTPAAPTNAAQRVAWKKDDSVQECERCSRSFTFYRRRHHCRRCGHIFCADCASEKAVGISGWTSPERVCKICRAMSGTLRPLTLPRERRIVMLGAQGVGKTTLRNAFSSLPAPSATSTWDLINASVASTTSAVVSQNVVGRRYRHKTGVDYSLFLQHTLGQPQLGLFQAALAVGTHAYILVFSADDRSSLNALKIVRERIFDCGGQFQPCFVVCTNSRSELMRTVAYEEGNQAATEMMAHYVEVNTTKEADLNALFDRVLDEIVAREAF